MNKEEKNQLITELADKLNQINTIYITDISDLNSESSNNLRRLCFKRDVKLVVVKNTLLKKAMEKTNKNFENLYTVLVGPTSLMFADSGNLPARLIQEFRKESNRPILKGAYIEEMIFIGDEQLDKLANIKSKEELLGDIILMLQSPMRNLISALQSGGNKLSGIMKTLSEKSE